MADLIDRLTHDSEYMTPARPGIAVHAFASDYIMYAAGTRTNTEIIQAYDLQGDELAQAILIKTVLDGKTTAINKMIYSLKVQSVALLLGAKPDSSYPNPNVYFDINGNVNKTRVAADLEIT